MPRPALAVALRPVALAVACLTGWSIAGAQSVVPAAGGSTSPEPDAAPVQFRHDDLVVRAARIESWLNEDRVRASGPVILERGTDRFSGSLLDLDTRTRTGFVIAPTYRFGRTGAGGVAERIDFLGPDRFLAARTTYTSCPIDEDEPPAWELTTRRLQIDLQGNEGIAEGAVLRFQGVPILAAPVMSFPVTDERKSGLLPPIVNLSSNAGFELGTPYYLNLAPNLDATLTPFYSTRRGLALGSEFRYLTEAATGTTRLHWLPKDLSAGTERWAFRGNHGGRLWNDTDFEVRWLRVSDDNYWSDGLRGADSLTPRLLASTARVEQRRRWQLGAAGDVEQRLYAGADQWQLLQDLSAGTRLTEPYRRRPQLGGRWRNLEGRLDWSVELELNRFTHRDTTLAQGTRAHALGSVALPIGDAGWQVTPRLGFNGAAYDVDAGLGTASLRERRLIPTVSLDSQWWLERETAFWGEALTQTLEPRILYVRTPWRDQASLPQFDSAALDFNPTSVFSPSAFSGIDRVSDAHQATVGVSTRLIRRSDGSEMARLGIAQRFLFSDQRITPDGTPLTKRSSDVLVFGSTDVLPRWHLDGVVQYNPETDQVSRSILNLRYSPGPFRTLSMSYRAQLGASEQVAFGWQWPLWGVRHEPLWPVRDRIDAAASERSATQSGSSCRGTLYGVGRLEYSLRDHRTSGAIAGLEYDAGCWIGRIVAQRKSTGVDAQTTTLSLQLELIGLARIDVGTNPLRALKDNVPGFRLLNDGSARGTDPDEQP